MNIKHKPLTRKINFYFMVDGLKSESLHSGLLIEDIDKCRAYGDCTNISGCIGTELIGDISGLYGDVTGFIGDATGVEGNVDSIQKPVNSIYHLDTFTKVFV